MIATTFELAGDHELATVRELDGVIRQVTERSGRLTIDVSKVTYRDWDLRSSLSLRAIAELGG